MKHIYQHYATDCTVACFAMLFGISWWRSMGLIFPLKRFMPFANFRFDIASFDKAAVKLGWKIGYMWGNDINFPINHLQDNAMVVFGFDDLHSHAVIWDIEEQKFLDPDRRSNLPDEYIRNNIRWIAVKVK